MKKKALSFGCLLLSTVSVWASPGAVDRYGCHRDPSTGDRHCHGSTEEAKRTHVLMGVISTTDAWFYNDGPANIFSGVGAQLEVGWEHIAGYGAYHYEWHLTGSRDFSVRGWDIGAKAGPDIAKLGLHPFVLAGFYSFTFEVPGQLLPYSGLQYGAGLVLNRPSSAMELKLVYRDPADVEANWQLLGYSGVTATLNAQLGYHFRF